MKRLLTYLFLVLGLTILFQSKSDAADVIDFNCKYTSVDKSFNLSLDRNAKIVVFGYSKEQIIYEAFPIIIFTKGSRNRILNISTGELHQGYGGTEYDGQTPTKNAIESYLKGKQLWPAYAICNKSETQQVAKLDTTGPEIEIAEPITVKDNTYTLEGKVSDQGSDKIYMEVDGRFIPVKKGKFKIVGFSPLNEEIEVKIVAMDSWGNKSTKVVKVNMDIKKEPKKEKKKVAKVAEQEQEEFKPKKKDLDNDPPIIEIAEAITVDSQSYTLKGKVKDKSKQIYLTVDGRPVEVNRGKFTQDRFNIDPEVVEEIKIVAIDKWNNKSEKTVKVTVKLKATEVVRIYEDLKPNKVKVSKDKNKIAIIIGIEKYKNMAECNYCNRDAKAFKAYATRALGVVPSNIISLVGSKATRGEILRAFKISLPRIAGDGGKDINIFFAGHGLASESGEELYIIPQDGDESLLEDTAISRVELIKLIKKVDPKSVTMFFDTCYSGQTRGEQMLVASLRGIRIVEAEGIPDNFAIFTASSSNQGSSHIEEAKHGMFSYYLMKGLEGKADGNKDDQITNGELIAYLKTNVSKEAFTQNREQDPMLSGDPNQVLMKY